MGTPALTRMERAYIELQMRLLAQASRKSAAAGRKWRELNASWNDWADRTGLHDPKQRADAKKVNVALNDASAAHGFWALDTQRISATIVGYAMGRMLVPDQVIPLRELEQLLRDTRELERQEHAPNGRRGAVA